MSSPAYPNGQCDVCGFGLNEDECCTNPECTDYDTPDDVVEIVVTTTCQATIEEKWVLRVPPEVAAEIEADTSAALDYLGGEYATHIEDSTLGGEEDRDLVKVERNGVLLTGHA